MERVNGFIRSTARQLAILTGVMVLTFAAGIEWAEAAEMATRTTGAMPSELHVIFLFLLMLGGLAAMLFRPQERMKVRGRPEKRRPTRR